MGKAIQIDYKINWSIIPPEYRFFTFDADGFYFWTERPYQKMTDRGIKFEVRPDPSDSFKVTGTRAKFTPVFIERQDV